MDPKNAGSLGSTPQGESWVLEGSGTKAQRAWADGAEMALQSLCDQGQVRSGHFGRGSEVSWVGKPPQGDNSSSLQTRVWAKTQGRICGSSTPSKARVPRIYTPPLGTRREEFLVWLNVSAQEKDWLKVCITSVEQKKQKPALHLLSYKCCMGVNSFLRKKVIIFIANLV